MSLRTRWAVAVFLAATVAAAVPNAYAQPKPGQGSLGMRIGVPYFTGDADTKLGQFKQDLRTNEVYYHLANGIRG